MNVVIVDRDQEAISPLISELERNGFKVVVVENSAGVLSFINKTGVQFLIADSPLLVGHTLGDEVRRKSPMARLIVLAAHPTMLGMVEALSSGANDYFPRSPECFSALVDTVLAERARLARWRMMLLAPGPGGSSESPENI